MSSIKQEKDEKNVVVKSEYVDQCCDCVSTLLLICYCFRQNNDLFTNDGSFMEKFKKMQEEDKRKKGLCSRYYYVVVTAAQCEIF